jgi:glycosyltransferase involved in cell wall biosynthesis
MTANNKSPITNNPQKVQRRLRVLLSAYACCPHHGSEPEVGWAFSKALAAHHDVWVLTRTAHRERIEKELQQRPVQGLRFLYYDPPELFGWGSHGGVRMQVHSYCWQLLAVSKVWNFHRELGFDIAHHVTFAKYWAPSCLAWLPVPFVWGPVGGAEVTPRGLLSALTWKERALERLKQIAARAGELDPFVRKTARRADRVFASTEETAVRLRRMGCSRVEVMTQIGVEAGLITSGESRAGACRFISIGRLIHWKGFLLGLQAFSSFRTKDSEYWIVGDGPSRASMERFVAERGLQNQVKFFGSLSRTETEERLAAADVLVHPSFHDSAGLVCLEAMAVGKPVVCLNTGGPAGLIDDSCGIRIAAGSAAEVRDGLCAAMSRLASDPVLRQRMGLAAQERVRNCFDWKKKAEWMSRCYIDLAECGETF